MTGRIFCQTFATDIIDKLSKYEKEKMFFLHYLSALSIKKQMSKNDKFYLITDSIGKDMVKDFPYDEIITALDDYPYIRPLKMSVYKIYSIELFKNQTFIHFDNDVILFKQIPEFEDVIVQSNEYYYIKKHYEENINNFEWILPDYVKKIENNYNPGIFGFTYNSKIRNKYFKECLKYSELNINFVLNIQDSLVKYQYLNKMQDIYLIIEEGFLFHFCKENEIDVVEFIPNKYTYSNGKPKYLNVWGSKDKKYKDCDWDRIININYKYWKNNDYIHFMGYKEKRDELVQDVFLNLYNLYKHDIDLFFLNQKNI